MKDAEKLTYLSKSGLADWPKLPGWLAIAHLRRARGQPGGLAGV